MAFEDPPSALSAAQPVRHSGVDKELRHIGGARNHLARDYPWRSRLCCLTDEKIVVPHDHPVVIVRVDDKAEGLPADSRHNVGRLLLKDAPSLDLAATDAMCVVRHAVRKKRLDQALLHPEMARVAAGQHARRGTGTWRPGELHGYGRLTDYQNRSW